jgi:hypothetical protein
MKYNSQDLITVKIIMVKKKGGDNGMRPLQNEIAFAQSYMPAGGELVAQSTHPLSNLIAVAIIAVVFIAACVTIRRRLKA